MGFWLTFRDDCGTLTPPTESCGWCAAAARARGGHGDDGAVCDDGGVDGGLGGVDGFIRWWLRQRRRFWRGEADDALAGV